MNEKRALSYIVSFIVHFLYQPVENKHKNWGNPRLTKEMVKSRFKGIYTC